LLTVSACVTDPNTGERKVSRAAIGGGAGALGGLLVGSIIGGGTARVLGAGIGGIAGAAIGAQKDKQIRELREETAGSGIDVSESDDGRSILVNLPEGVTFDTASYTLKPQFRQTLDRVADNLERYPDSLVDVYGHTDAVGSEAYNQTLSENRAQTVASYLTTQGVASARLRSQGFGETMPIADNGTEEGRARNRRVEIKIVPISQDDVRAAHGGYRGRDDDRGQDEDRARDEGSSRNDDRSRGEDRSRDDDRGRNQDDGRPYEPT
jgi:outer membrane protein OmpA-like peptidoglycan-associated protein